MIQCTVAKTRQKQPTYKEKRQPLLQHTGVRSTHVSIADATEITAAKTTLFQKT